MYPVYSRTSPGEIGIVCSSKVFARAPFALSRRGTIRSSRRWETKSAWPQPQHPETGQTPAARWAAGDWLPRMPDSLDALDLLLLTVATPRKVQRDGIHCHGLRYFSLTLAAYVGEPVTIRYDPRDLAEIRVYHRDKFLCQAVSPDIAAVTVSLQDLQAARNQRRRDCL